MLAFNAWNLLLSASFVILGALQAYSIPLTTVVAEGSEPRSMQNFTLRELASEDENGNSAPHRLVKRFDDARFSFYDAGLGACGEVNTNSDFIVALNIAQWNNRAHCGETITISYGGKTATARIMDLCPGCPYGGLDLTRGLFSYFAPQSVGIIHGSWNFGGSSGGSPRPSPSPRPATTSTPRPTPIDTPRPSPTPTPTPTPTTTRRPSTTHTPTTSAAPLPPPPPPPPPSTSTSSTSLAEPTPPLSVGRVPGNVLHDLNVAFVRFATLLIELGKLNPEDFPKLEAA